jgi:hypothetical protein
MDKKRQRAELAKAKAKGQLVFISGLQGLHTLETGVAYHYRGHYVYSYPAGTPILPVPFSTSGGIHVAGTVRECAPEYDPAGPGLVPEASIAALKRSCEIVWNAQQEQEKQPAEQVEVTPTARVPSHTSTSSLSREYAALRQPQHNAGFALNMPSTIGNLPSIFVNDSIFTPHDRARYLADSAPGSRLASYTNTPHASRSVSPMEQSYTLDTRIRHIASTTGLNQLGVQERLSVVAKGTRPPPLRRRHSYTDPATEAEAQPNQFDAGVAMSPPWSRNKPIGTGRPRRASMALNHAYNAANPAPGGGGAAKPAPKCALHGGDCDGVSTSMTWKTQHAKETTGFRDLYPVVRGVDGREMVDWERLMMEERASRRG